MPPRDPKLIGSLRPRGEGKWQSQARIPGTNRTVSKTWRAANLTEARKLHAQWIADVLGDKVGPAGPTLEDHLARWLGRQQLHPATERAYRYVIARIVEWEGHTRLRDLTPRKVDDLLATLAGSYSQSALQQCRQVLGQAMQWAVVRGELAVNPLTNIGRHTSRKRSEPRLAATTEQVRAIIDAETDPMWRTFWLVIAGTGARSGEVAALQWADVDWDGGTINIRRTMTTTTDGRKVPGESTKNRAGVRNVPVHPSTVQALAARRAELAGIRLHLADRPAWVFPYGDGPPKSQTISKRWRAVLDTAGIEADIKPHSIRHWAASTMLRNRQDPHIVAKNLGHSVAQLMQLYGAHIPADLERAALEGLPDVGVGLP